MIRIAIVGTGNIAHAHVGAYKQFPDRCQIVALVDIVPEKAQRMKEHYGLEAEVYDDHLKILGRTDIDLVDVCTPPYVHASISINALRSGKNVVCEKPIPWRSATPCCGPGTRAGRSSPLLPRTASASPLPT